MSGNIFGCQKLWNVTGIQWVEAKNATQDSPTTKNGLAHSVKSLEVENSCYGLMEGREEKKEGRSRELGISRERKQKRMILVGCSTPTPAIVYRKLSVGLYYD